MPQPLQAPANAAVDDLVANLGDHSADHAWIDRLLELDPPACSGGQPRHHQRPFIRFEWGRGGDPDPLQPTFLVDQLLETPQDLRYQRQPLAPEQQRQKPFYRWTEIG